MPSLHKSSGSWSSDSESNYRPAKQSRRLVRSAILCVVVTIAYTSWRYSDQVNAARSRVNEVISTRLALTPLSSGACSEAEYEAGQWRRKSGHPRTISNLTELYDAAGIESCAVQYDHEWNLVLDVQTYVALSSKNLEIRGLISIV